MALVRFTTPRPIFGLDPLRGTRTKRLPLRSPDQGSREAASSGRIRSIVAPFKLTGYAAPFNELSQVIPGEPNSPFREMILPGAFRQSIRVDDVTCVFVSHIDQWCFGSTKDGTLTLVEDHRGLRFELTPPLGLGDYLVDQVRGEAYPGMSFRFRAEDEEWESLRGERVKILKRITLLHICPVTRPAYSGTSIQIEAAG